MTDTDAAASDWSPHLYLPGLDQLVKPDDDQQPEARQEDVEEDAAETRKRSK